MTNNLNKSLMPLMATDATDAADGAAFGGCYFQSVVRRFNTFLPTVFRIPSFHTPLIQMKRSVYHCSKLLIFLKGFHTIPISLLVFIRHKIFSLIICRKILNKQISSEDLLVSSILRRQ